MNGEPMWTGDDPEYMRGMWAKMKPELLWFGVFAVSVFTVIMVFAILEKHAAPWDERLAGALIGFYMGNRYIEFRKKRIAERKAKEAL